MLKQSAPPHVPSTNVRETESLVQVVPSQPRTYDTHAMDCFNP